MSDSEIPTSFVSNLNNFPTEVDEEKYTLSPARKVRSDKGKKRGPRLSKLDDIGERQEKKVRKEGSGKRVQKGSTNLKKVVKETFDEDNEKNEDDVSSFFRGC